MKVIQVPEPVKAEIKVVQGGVVVVEELKWKFSEWLVHCIDSVNSKGKEDARKANKVVAAIEKFNGAKEIMLEDEHFKVVQDSTENPNWYRAANRQFVPFYDAVENAKDEETATDKKKK